MSQSDDVSTLAGQKTTKLSGGNNSYYLTNLGYAIVEAEDIIERLKMEFHLATTFKSTDRLCKLRLGLGKPGSTVEYEVGKIVYYNMRSVAVSQRREKAVGWFGAAVRYVRDVFNPGYFDDIDNFVLDLPDPKRCKPCEFRIGDFINALKPNPFEKEILRNVFKVALMRLVAGPPMINEVANTQVGAVLATGLDQSVKDGSYQ